MAVITSKKKRNIDPQALLTVERFEVGLRKSYFLRIVRWKKLLFYQCLGTVIKSFIPYVILPTYSRTDYPSLPLLSALLLLCTTV